MGIGIRELRLCGAYIFSLEEMMKLIRAQLIISVFLVPGDEGGLA